MLSLTPECSLAYVYASRVELVYLHHLLSATEPLEQLLLGELQEERVGVDPVDASHQLNTHGGQSSPGPSYVQTKIVQQLNNMITY